MFTWAKKVVSMENKVSRDPENHSGVRFSIVTIRGKEYCKFRIGKDIAKKMGLRPKDRMNLGFAADSGMGVLQRVKIPDGWSLGSGDTAEPDFPPLVLVFTWYRRLPRVEESSLCEDARIDKSLDGIVFKFPELTIFPVKEAKEEIKEAPKKIRKVKKVDELYEQHKAMIEVHGVPQRRYAERGMPTRRRDDN